MVSQEFNGIYKLLKVLNMGFMGKTEEESGDI